MRRAGSRTRAGPAARCSSAASLRRLGRARGLDHVGQRALGRVDAARALRAAASRAASTAARACSTPSTCACSGASSSPAQRSSSARRCAAGSRAAPPGRWMLCCSAASRAAPRRPAGPAAGRCAACGLRRPGARACTRSRLRASDCCRSARCVAQLLRRSARAGQLRARLVQLARLLLALPAAAPRSPAPACLHARLRSARGARPAPGGTPCFCAWRAARLVEASGEVATLVLSALHARAQLLQRLLRAPAPPRPAPRPAPCSCLSSWPRASTPVRPRRCADSATQSRPRQMPSGVITDSPGRQGGASASRPPRRSAATRTLRQQVAARPADR